MCIEYRIQESFTFEILFFSKMYFFSTFWMCTSSRECKRSDPWTALNLHQCMRWDPVWLHLTPGAESAAWHQTSPAKSGCREVDRRLLRVSLRAKMHCFRPRSNKAADQAMLEKSRAIQSQQVSGDTGAQGSPAYHLSRLFTFDIPLSFSAQSLWV